MLRYLTAGESHGQGLIGILDGYPAGIKVSAADINKDLARRQVGYGRGNRMQIENDKAEILSGVRWGRSLGGPISLLIKNKDWLNWQKAMSISSEYEDSVSQVTKPRPGHADLSGLIKYCHKDIRNILERASARETAIRVAIGAVCKLLLKEFNIKIISHVTEIGGVGIDKMKLKLDDIQKKAESSLLRCADKDAEKKMIKRVDSAKRSGDSLGGVFEVIVANPPIGLGSHTQWDRKINARLSNAIMSIQAIKGVEIGLGFEAAKRFGSDVHDEIFYDNRAKRFYRKTNNAGGIEGGMTNGEEIIIRAAMKPIPTLMKPLRSVDIFTKKPFKASIERSDVCAVPAAGIVGEAVVAFEIANAMIEKFGGDSLSEMMRNYNGYMKYVRGV
ncbi:MAG: chorismate synthase [Nitrospirota bacterium]